MHHPKKFFTTDESSKQEQEQEQGQGQQQGRSREVKTKSPSRSLSGALPGAAALSLSGGGKPLGAAEAASTPAALSLSNSPASGGISIAPGYNGMSRVTDPEERPPWAVFDSGPLHV